MNFLSCLMSLSAGNELTILEYQALEGSYRVCWELSARVLLGHSPQKWDSIRQLQVIVFSKVHQPILDIFCSEEKGRKSGTALGDFSQLLNVFPSQRSCARSLTRYGTILNNRLNKMGQAGVGVTRQMLYLQECVKEQSGLSPWYWHACLLPWDVTLRRLSWDTSPLIWDFSTPEWGEINISVCSSLFWFFFLLHNLTPGNGSPDSPLSQVNKTPANL